MKTSLSEKLYMKMRLRRILQPSQMRLKGLAKLINIDVGQSPLEFFALASDTSVAFRRGQNSSKFVKQSSGDDRPCQEIESAFYPNSAHTDPSCLNQKGIKLSSDYIPWFSQCSECQRSVRNVNRKLQ